MLTNIQRSPQKNEVLCINTKPTYRHTHKQYVNTVKTAQIRVNDRDNTTSISAPYKHKAIQNHQSKQVKNTDKQKIRMYSTR